MTQTPAAASALLAAAAARPDVYARVAHKRKPAAVHRQWLGEIAQAVATPGARVLLVAPPGSAKSTYTSLLLPQWYLGNHPDHAVLAITSSDAMASQFHGVVELGLRTNQARRAIWPQPDRTPAPDRGWSEDGLYLRGVPDDVKDPSYRCVGFGAKVVGSRCHLLLLDDPVDQDTSLSEAGMRRVRRELDNVLLPRLHPEGVAICITTRWSEGDTGGYLLDQGWRLVLTPALGDYPWLGGEHRITASTPLAGPEDIGLGSVWPGRWALDWLLRERRRLGSAQWSTVWMCDPLAVGAGVFRSASWFRPLPEDFASRIRPRLTLVTFIDLAWSSKQSADYTAAVTLGFDPTDPMRTLYWLATFHAKVDEPDLPGKLADHLAAVRPTVVGVEWSDFQTQATARLIADLRTALNGRLACAVLPVRVATDKVTRARVPAATAEAGLLCVDREAGWWPGTETELLRFPLAAHDDRVDALSGASTLALEWPGAGAAQGNERPVAISVGGRWARVK